MNLLRSSWLVSLLALVACAAPVTEQQPSETIDAISSRPSAPSAPSSTPSSITPAMTGLSVSVHTTLGIPEAASVDDPAHALLVKQQYVVSFDSTKQNPRWTSWELSSKWVGSSGRSSSWLVDRSLPSSMKQASNADYTNSGFQRGHLCPSGDRTDSVADNAATFVFTNAVPQTAQSNTGPWEAAERQERALSDAGHHLFIVAGSTYGATHDTIGDDVWVPATMWKVIVVMDGDAPKPSDVTTSTRVISIEIPNTTDVHGDWRTFTTTMGDLEAKSGMTFLSDVDRSVHDALATVRDPG